MLSDLNTGDLIQITFGQRQDNNFGFSVAPPIATTSIRARYICLTCPDK